MPSNNETGAPAAGGGSPSAEMRRKRDTSALTQQAKDTINTVADQAKDAANTVADEVTSGVDQLAQAAKEQIAEANERARGLVEEQKDHLAGQLGGVAQAMDRVAGDLEGSNDASARYARMLADNAGKLSGAIRDKSIDDLMTDAQDFGRRQPAMFLGAAALLGFAASRFLLASASRSTRTLSGGEVEEDRTYVPESTARTPAGVAGLETGRS
jgi:hypothetical protein